MPTIHNHNTRLSSDQRQHYRERGYHFPLRVFDELQARSNRELFLEYLRANEAKLKDLLPRQKVGYFAETHLFLNWVYRIVSHPGVLDAVESVLGPNIMVWNSHWFPKFPGDRAYVSWHQDATYWGLTPPNVTTAWIALSESMPENGCLRVLPRSHRTPLLPQRETYAADNMLSRGQEIAVEVDEAQTVQMCLQPGEFSLHHIGIVHGSGANDSTVPRIGLAVRYISPDVVQSGCEREIVLLVRGTDEFGNFEVVDPPRENLAYGESAVHEEAMKRKVRNIMPKSP
jgi:non-haem Fe2+, alpha-ketoglutarate-dependent halogenase